MKFSGSIVIDSIKIFISFFHLQKFDIFWV